MNLLQVRSMPAGARRAAVWSVSAAVLLALVLAWSTEDAGAAPLAPEARTRMRRSGVVGDALIAALDGHEKVRVIVVLTPSHTGALVAGARDRTTAKMAIRRKQRDVMDMMAPEDFDVIHQFRSIDALAGTISAAGLLRLLDSPDVARVDIDSGGSAHLAEALPLTRMDEVQDLGFTGDGVTVAVIDSGVDTDHPDLANSIVAEQCFCGCGDPDGCCPDGSSVQSGLGSAEDEHGHGTNVAGIITSDGVVAPRGGAPDANLVAVRVLDGNSVFYCSSDVIAGMDWILENHPEVNIVNMSLGTTQLFAGDCDTSHAFARAVDTLRANGTLVFASSGNQGSDGQMAAPACASNAISVGAVWDSDLGARTFSRVCTDLTTRADQVTCFSNSNEGTDLFAPGGLMTSSGIHGGTSNFTGTSQAAPAAAACAALLWQANPTLSADQVEAALKDSPVVVTDDTSTLSFPRVDCAAALEIVGMPSPTPTPTPSPVPTAPTPAMCTGDCNSDQFVSINELVVGVGIVLEVRPLASCAAFDEDNSGAVTVNELVSSVGNALSECR